MGQMIDEEDCEVCIPFDQEWIFTYGDLVTIDIASAGRLTLIYMTDPEGNVVELQKWHADSDS